MAFSNFFIMAIILRVKAARQIIFPTQRKEFGVGHPPKKPNKKKRLVHHFYKYKVYNSQHSNYANRNVDKPSYAPFARARFVFCIVAILIASNNIICFVIASDLHKHKHHQNQA